MLRQVHRNKPAKDPYLFSVSVPLLELHMSNEPIALFISSTGKLLFYKIKTKGRYFVKNTGQIRGIYSINNKYRYTLGKTSVYFFAAQETNQIDPILINELNNYMIKNQLSELRRKDIKHGSHLRTLLKQKKTVKESIDHIKQTEEANDIALQENVQGVTDAIEKRITDLRQKHQKDLDVSDAERSYVLLEHLKKINKIDDVEYADLLNKAENNTLTFDTLIDELKEKHIVRVSEPLNENVEDFVQDLGAQNAADLAGFVQDLRNNKKGLKDLTPAPVKSFMSAGILFAIILGALIGIPVIIGQLPAMEKALGQTGHGGMKMPWSGLMGGFDFWLYSHLPMFLTKWF